MARPGRFDYLKPEILRLLAEGLSFGEILRLHPELPKGTLHGWYNHVKHRSELVQNGFEISSEPEATPRLRMPIDPESPLEKIKNALWDIVYDPQGKQVAVQALNILLRIEAPYLMGVSVPVEKEDDDNENEILVTRQIVDSHAEA